MEALARWHRQGRRTTDLLRAITNAGPSVEGASRAVNLRCHNSVMALICGSHTTALDDSCAVAANGIRWVVFGKAGPRCARRCSSSHWRAPVASSSALQTGVAVGSERAAVRRSPHLRSTSEPNTSLNPDPPSRGRRRVRGLRWAQGLDAKNVGEYRAPPSRDTPGLTAAQEARSKALVELGLSKKLCR
jgi:hypothetical protein